VTPLPTNRTMEKENNPQSMLSQSGSIVSQSGSYHAPTKITVQKPETIDKEINWLVREEFPSTCKQIKKTLQDCIKFMIKSIAKTKAEKEKTVEEDVEISLLEDSRILQFKSADGSMTGFLVIEGFNISEAEINVKFQKWNKGNAQKSSIKSNNPFRLSQLYNLVKFLELAVSDIDGVFEEFGPSFDTLNLFAARQILATLSQRIIKAQDQLIFPTKTKLPKNIPPQNRFQPSAPKELVIEFEIVNKEIQILAYIIAPIISPKQEKDHKPVIATFQDSAHIPYYIQEQLDFQIAQIKKLQTISTFLDAAYTSCSDLDDQVVTLSAYL